MTLKKYLIGIALSTVFCLVAFGLVLFYVDPYNTSFVGYLSFYASLLFTIIGSFTLIGFYVRIWSSGNEVVYAHVAPAFRQAIFLGVIIIGSLLLQAFRLLTWWDALLFVLSIVLLEFFFMARMRRRDYLVG